MKFVPHIVHDDETLRMNACKDFVGTADDEPGFFEYHYHWMRVLAFPVRSSDPKIRVRNSKSHISQRPKEGSFPQILHKNHADYSSIPMG